MLLLPRNVFAHRLTLRCAPVECAVALLPCERGLADFLMHPARRHRFHIAHHIRETSRGAQADEQMHMVGHAADGLRDAFDVSHHPAEIGVQPLAPHSSDDWHTVLGAKNDVEMKREMGGWHGCEVPAPRPGRVSFLPAIRWLPPPANFDAALRAFRAWCAVAYAFPTRDGYEDAGSGWPRALRRFAAEAWRRADAGDITDEELYPCNAQWVGLYDRMHSHEDDETARRYQIAADYGERADG